MAAQALEQSALEGKDKDQLLQIAKALGVKGISKLKKADLIGAIIDATGGSGDPAPEPAAPASSNGTRPTPSVPGPDRSPTPETRTSTAASPSPTDDSRDEVESDAVVVLLPDDR